mmetsp:Transcript_6676/g.16335  ORF Transcript_6676/g.16335 Transcript_6676/m.16335 type:complete len:203 (-) Transcript_6676:84-692(-)|eukprot:2734735-Amphidinium_carterae.1
MGSQVCCQSEDCSTNTTPSQVDQLPVFDAPEVLELEHDQQSTQKLKLQPAFSLLENDFGLDDLPDLPPPKHSTISAVAEAEGSGTPETQASSRRFSPPPIDTMSFDDGDFVMKLERKPSNVRVGFSMHNSVGEECIRIRAVHTGGLAEEWNLVNPTTLVQPGDAIVRVNGISTAEEMRKLLGDPQQKMLQIAIKQGSKKLGH